MTRPASGARFALARAETTDEAFVYRGFVHLPDEDLPLEVTVARGDGATKARVEGREAAKLEAAAAALVRAATKASIAEGLEPPRKIVRWRG